MKQDLSFQMVYLATRFDSHYSEDFIKIENLRLSKWRFFMQNFIKNTQFRIGETWINLHQFYPEHP